LPALNRKRDVPIKNPGIIKTERDAGGAANLKRKTAGYDARARLPSGKNV
jgi:hypothetical protein